MPNIEVSTSTIDRLLDGHGYSVKLLTQRPVDRNRADVKQLRRRYAQWLQSEGTTLTRYYIDETNFNMASTAMSSIGPITQVQNKEGKRTIVLVGCIVIILLAIVDSVLFYFWLMAPAQARARTAAALRDRTGYDGDDSESGEYPILFDFADPRKVGGRSGAWRLCVTAGCSWLDTYMAAHPVEVSDPCDDFYVHACARHDRSVYEDGRARLMDAMVDALLDRSLVLTTPGDGVVAGAGVARRNQHRGDTRDEHLDMLKLCLSGDQPTVSTSDFDRRACQWVSLAARCHLPDNLGRSDADLRAYQRAWKALYFAPFLGPQANPLLSHLYGDASAPRVHACLTIMADVFEDAALTAAKQVLEQAVDDLERSVSQLGRDARLAMHEFTQYMMTEEAPDFEELALPGGISSQDRNDDLQVTLVDSYYGSAKDMDLFASQARLVESNRRRLLLVAPGLLGLLVNVSSSVEPFLVPALAKPLLRAMLADWKPEALSQAAPSARILDKLSRCFTTWINVSEPLSAEVAAEVVILEPLFQLYRYNATPDHATPAEYFQISDLSISYASSGPHLALDFTALVGRTLRYNPWFAIHMTHPPYYRDVCQDIGATCAYEMCGFTTPSTGQGRQSNNCPIEKGKYSINVTLPAPPLIDSQESLWRHSEPHRVIQQDLLATRPQDQADHSDAPTSHSSPIDGPSPESLSPSPTPVRAHELVALSPQRSRVSRGNEPGQRHPDGATEDTQLQDERVCIVLWVVGAALAFPLILSAWLVLVPFFVHANWTTRPPFSFTSQYTTSTVSSTPFTTTAVPLTSTSPWPNVPSACIAPVAWSTLPPRLNVSAPYSFGPSNESSRPVFCLYNNTRVNVWRNITNSRWDYVFATMPFAFCPYVVYWSVGIEDGNLTSRQPSFDEHYGLGRLRAIVDSLNFNTIKILLALGGYPEDAPHFSRLGWDKEVMGRLMGNVADALNMFGLNGITLHWVEARAGCDGPDDVTVLKTLLHSFRTCFNDRMLPDVMITIILELNRASQLVVQEAADVVDHFFLATQHEGRYTQRAFYEICEARTTAIHAAYRMFVSGLPSKTLRRSQLCLSDSLSLRLDFPCVLHFAKQASMDNLPDRMIMIDDASEVEKRLDWTEINVTTLASTPGDSSHVCVLLHDFDGDNYVDQCGGRFVRYALTRNYYYGSVGRRLFGNGYINALASCKFTPQRDEFLEMA
ncbi:hypothetical protein HPB52_000324 [Rhipicephalus sanguineus]|uniref:Chitinase n=1 Tax=Rhipicephalus sanguineus TaxID=34632 RepID=A0A9D4PDQ2_RHISA|nr:hypothetical protein HPB52_000324 [Rhipicephalus sanguineus]